jgi:hypothetical protein
MISSAFKAASFVEISSTRSSETLSELGHSSGFSPEDQAATRLRTKAITASAEPSASANWFSV